MDAKKLLNTYPRINTDKIIQSIDKYSVVSFDVFDTLVKRDIESEHDVFLLAEKKFNEDEKEESIDGFLEIRIKAEEDARAKASVEEITDADIYKEIVGKKDKQGKVISQEMAEHLNKAERWAEEQLCVANSAFLPIYKHCLDAGKRIILVSDMYWSLEFVEKLLNQCGITGYNKLYISSDIGYQKRTGNLFTYVLKEEGITPPQVVHIGDNKKADYLIPKKKRIKAISIPKYDYHTKYLQHTHAADLEWKVIKAYINNRIEEIDDENEKIGYEIYGPLLYTFVKWIAEKVDKTKTILFFARDCHVVIPAFRDYCSSNNGVYFLGSRRSLIIPSLHDDASLEKVQKLVKSESKKMTVAGLLKKIGLDEKQYETELKQYGLSGDTIIDRDELLENEPLVSFYSCILEDVRSNAEEEYRAFSCYWESLGCGKEIQIVDIGWRGTMQYCLENLLPDDYKVTGYYLGVKSDAVISNCEGLFINGEEDFEKDCFLASISALIEIFFSAPHGSVEKYYGDGKVHYLPYECENRKDKQLFVNSLQNGSLRFVHDYSSSEISESFAVNPEHLFLALREMGLNPDKKELAEFGDYPFQLGTGVVNAADPKSILYYFIHPKQYLYDFANSNWKIAFLKKSIKIKLPYYKVFSWIYKHRG